MNKWLVAVVAIVAALAIVASAFVLWDKPEKLVFAFPPGETTDISVVEKEFGSVIDALCGQVDAECEIIVTTDYAAVMEALRNGSADVARIGATMYVLTRDEFDMRLVAWDVIEGSDHYHAVLIGKPGIWTEPYTLDQLKGKTVAFVTTASTSGYIAPLTAMTEMGLTLDDLKSYYFAENHPAAVEAVLNGQADVAATGDTVIKELVDSGRAVEGQDFVLLWESPPLVMDAWTIGPGVDRAMADKIAAALLSLPPSAFEGAYISGLSPIDLSAYEFNAKMLRITGQLK